MEEPMKKLKKKNIYNGLLGQKGIIQPSFKFFYLYLIIDQIIVAKTLVNIFMIVIVTFNNS
jgi:hypothetical protein